MNFVDKFFNWVANTAIKLFCPGSTGENAKVVGLLSIIVTFFLILELIFATLAFIIGLSVLWFWAALIAAYVVAVIVRYIQLYSKH